MKNAPKKRERSVLWVPMGTTVYVATRQSKSCSLLIMERPDRCRRESTVRQTERSLEAQQPAPSPSPSPSPGRRRSPRLNKRRERREGTDSEPDLDEPEMSCKAVRETGLVELLTGTREQASAAPSAGKKRARKDGTWKYVTIVEENKQTAVVKCIFCDVAFKVASVTRIVDHLLGRPGVKACASECDGYHVAVEGLRKEEDSKKERKLRKATINQVTELAKSGVAVWPSSGEGKEKRAGPMKTKQTPLLMKRSAPEDADDAVARFFFGNNIPTQVVDSKTFKDMVKEIRTAPLDWHPPPRQRLAGKCLERLARKLRMQEAPLRDHIFRNGGTVLSDGWDTIDRSHLLNQLVGNSEGVFFNGTIELQSNDHEDAKFVTSTFSSLINQTGPLAIVQVCSDTCSVMKAAWRAIEAMYPWISATPCGTHVLNLELKDLSKIDEVKQVEAKVRKVLSLFWGKKRWPRLKLREVITANHDGAKWGLYKAKQTRFAGKIREMARLLRARNDLQEVVVSSDYNKRKAKLNKQGRVREEEDVGEGEDECTTSIADEVKSIVLDENGFWSDLIRILRTTLPIVTLLRKMDCNDAVLSQVYAKMSEIQEYLIASSEKASWIPKALAVHKSRWEYLHAPMHAAAYALDPANLKIVKNIDEHCQSGLFTVIQRLCIRDVMLQNNCDVSSEEGLWHAATTFTASHRAVAQRTAQAEREFALYKSGMSPFNSASAELNARVMKACAWWELYGPQVPVIQGIAQRVLAQVSSAFAAERNWSVYGQVKSERKLRLSHGRADARVYCHESLQLHDKLHRVAVAEEVEWSDSDDSDVDSNVSADSEEEVAIEQLMR